LGKEGHSHVLNGWIDPTFDATQSLGIRLLQGWARKGVMNSLNTLDYLCEVIHPSPQSLLNNHTKHEVPSLCADDRVFIGPSGLVYELGVGEEYCNAVYTFCSFSKVNFWVSYGNSRFRVNRT
jgi:hypothetical protein